MKKEKRKLELPENRDKRKQKKTSLKKRDKRGLKRCEKKDSKKQKVLEKRNKP